MRVYGQIRGCYSSVKHKEENYEIVILTTELFKLIDFFSSSE